MRWEKAFNGRPSAVTCFTPRIVDVLIESGLAGNHFGLYHGFGRKIELGLLSNVDIGRALPYMDLGGHSGERPWRLAGQTRAGGARASSLGEAKRSPRVEGPRMSVLKGRNKDAVLASVPSGPISEAPVAWGGALLAPGYSLLRFQRIIRLRLSRGCGHAPLRHNPLAAKTGLEPAG